MATAFAEITVMGWPVCPHQDSAWSSCRRTCSLQTDEMRALPNCTLMDWKNWVASFSISEGIMGMFNQMCSIKKWYAVFLREMRNLIWPMCCVHMSYGPGIQNMGHVFFYNRSHEVVTFFWLLGEPRMVLIIIDRPWSFGPHFSDH